ncbi:TetR/AcrR family transcriptional regulator C-terminal domain-containing protein [Microlunatus soli]|uniref:Tetracyclin repressor, C-terminal all-alpha domain n=1 Tax=Microlunatus soli TaxID=630515 RepID=A0A1H1MZH7_9ACTN|nr:TetR/AcrR family transcriptional regulator C-terminal domain-containing protein [Microlunatus soli]SDR92027.1 Tetracyclin repressor, C-terminal all-alpha domain [Microlunatus soli]
MEQEPAVERAEHTARLLWRHREQQPRRRGPRPGRELDDVVAAGIAIADADGIAGLTVRGLTARLGLARMGLYTYVADLDQLVELMIDQAAAEFFDGRLRGFPYGPRSRRPADPRRGWRRAAGTLCDANLDWIRRHPWLVERPNVRPVLGPSSTAKYDAELGVFDRLGLTDLEMDLAVWQLLNHVRGIAVDLTAAAREPETSEQWWSAGAAAAAARITAAEFPLAVRVGTAAGDAQAAAYDPLGSYRFGLSRLLDGLQVMIDDAGSRHRQTLEFRPDEG